MKVHLITLAAFPYGSAESIHLAMFSKAMAKVCDFKLVTPSKIWRPRTFLLDTAGPYGISQGSFRQHKHLQLSRKGGDFISTAMKHAVRENALVYARQERVVAGALRAGLPCVWEIHSLPNAGAIRMLARGFQTGLLRRVVVISDALRSDIAEHLEDKALSARIIVARDAADCSRFLPAPGPGAARPSAGYIGSAYPGKGLEVIVPLAVRCPEVDFVLYGMQPSELSERFGNLPSNVLVKGKVQYSLVPEIMSEFDVALLPNQPSILMENGDDIGKYTSPMKMFEYMAAQKCILASDLPIIREVLTDGIDSLLAPHDDLEKWALKLHQVCGSADLRETVARNARKSFVEKYTYRARAEDVVRSLQAE